MVASVLLTALECQEQTASPTNVGFGQVFGPAHKTVTDPSKVEVPSVRTFSHASGSDCAIVAFTGAGEPPTSPLMAAAFRHLAREDVALVPYSVAVSHAPLLAPSMSSRAKRPSRVVRTVDLEVSSADGDVFIGIVSESWARWLLQHDQAKPRTPDVRTAVVDSMMHLAQRRSAGWFGTCGHGWAYSCRTGAVVSWGSECAPGASTVDSAKQSAKPYRLRRNIRLTAISGGAVSWQLLVGVNGQPPTVLVANLPRTLVLHLAVGLRVRGDTCTISPILVDRRDPAAHPAIDWSIHPDAVAPAPPVAHGASQWRGDSRA